MDLLFQLVDAWSRSQFLFDQEVTTFMRKAWVDAADVTYYEQVASGQTGADDEERSRSRKRAMEISRKYLQGELLRKTFLPHLKVSDGYLRMPRWLVINFGWILPRYRKRYKDRFGDLAE